jgi:hypothetical protein
METIFWILISAGLMAISAYSLVKRTRYESGCIGFLFLSSFVFCFIYFLVNAFINN